MSFLKSIKFSTAIQFTGFIILFWSLTFCAKKDGKNAHQNAIAKAYDNYLYYSDLNLQERYDNQADSINDVNYQIKNWLLSNVVLKQSANQLPKDIQAQIDEKVLEYKNELYDFAYKSEVVRQKMNPTIEDSIVQQYYDTYVSSYLLDEAYLRFVYVKCDKPKYVKEVEKWMKNSLDLSNLEDFCKEELQECHLYPDKWISLRSFESKLDGVKINSSDIKGRKSLIQLKNDNVIYLVKIIEFKDAGSPAPLSFVKEDIHSVLLNKKKTEFLNTFLNQLLDREMDKGKIKIFEEVVPIVIKENPEENESDSKTKKN
jgi:hypothetical protein